MPLVDSYRFLHGILKEGLTSDPAWLDLQQPGLLCVDGDRVEGGVPQGDRSSGDDSLWRALRYGLVSEKRNGALPPRALGPVTRWTSDIEHVLSKFLFASGKCHLPCRHPCVCGA